MSTVSGPGGISDKPNVGLLHPGEMGAAIGGALARTGLRVIWASEGRSAATARRAAAVGLEDVVSVEAVAAESDIVLSVVPPADAAQVAAKLGRFGGIYVDANAISPQTARTVAGIVKAAGGRCVDGGIIGGPPAQFGDARLYLSGAEAGVVAALFDNSVVDARVAGSNIGEASAVKLAFAGWTKGTAALLLALHEFARREGVEDLVLSEWSRPIPQPDAALARAAAARTEKGWRWAGEMLEIAAALGADELPGGFHEAAAEIFAMAPRPSTPGT